MLDELWTAPQLLLPLQQVVGVNVLIRVCLLAG